MFFIGRVCSGIVILTMGDVTDSLNSKGGITIFKPRHPQMAFSYIMSISRWISNCVFWGGHRWKAYLGVTACLEAKHTGYASRQMTLEIWLINVLVKLLPISTLFLLFLSTLPLLDPDTIFSNRMCPLWFAHDQKEFPDFFPYECLVFHYAS